MKSKNYWLACREKADNIDSKIIMANKMIRDKSRCDLINLTSQDV